jgi:oxygen-dependent protoporphyrinogen oxidase
VKVVIIGGGISGLSVAYYLEKYGAEHAPSITILEQADVLGGKMQTLHLHDMVIERGPDSFLARKQEMLDLIEELGMSEQLVSTNPAAKQVFVATNEKLVPLPLGLKLAIPTNVREIYKTPLLNVWQKLRVLADLILAKSVQANDGELDQSLGWLLRRRFGDAFVNQIAEPILAGIYAGQIDEISARATFPQFLQMAHQHRSLIRGAQQTETSVEQRNRAVQGMFLTLHNGFQSLTDALRNRLNHTEVRLNSKLIGVERFARYENEEARSNARYRLQLADQSHLDADLVVFTSITEPIVRGLTQALIDTSVPQQVMLGIPEQISVANLVLVYDAAQFQEKLTGTGFLVPRALNKLITACTWTSTKWPHTAPADRVILRVYIGRKGQMEWQNYTESQLLERAIGELRMWMNIPQQLIHHELNVWNQSMPQYKVGHLTWMKQFREWSNFHFPEIYWTGASFAGVGLPDCVRQARDLAKQIAHIAKKNVRHHGERF